MRSSAATTNVRPLASSHQFLAAALTALIVGSAIGCGNADSGAGNSASGSSTTGNVGGDFASGGVSGPPSSGNGGVGHGGAVATGEVIAVTFEPTAISRTFRQGEPISDLVIKARLSRTPTNITSTNVRDSLDLLAGTPTIAAEADGSFTATLQVVTRKPEPGTYSGAYSLVLCKSHDCSVVQALSPSSVPYTFTVTPLVSASFKLDGELQSQLTRGIDVYGVGWYRVDMKSGNQLEIESSLPVTWQLSDGLDSTIANIETPSPTTWRAVITLKDGLAAWLDDTISFRGLTADQQGINVDVYVSH